MQTERRNSSRHPLQISLREMNGEYFFQLRSHNLSEEGVFIENKFCVSTQEPFSTLHFTLPNGKQIRNVIARIVREEKRGARKGSAFQFLKISEEARMELKKFFLEWEAKSA